MATVPAFLLFKKSAVDEANDENVWPDGNEKSEGGEIRGNSVLSKSNGRILPTSGFNVMLQTISENISEIAMESPATRVFLKHKRVIAVKIHIKPPFPKKEIKVIMP